MTKELGSKGPDCEYINTSIEVKLNYNFEEAIKNMERLNKNKVVIFGVTGQDGSYLSELLLEKDYEVYGVKRRSSTRNDERVRHLISNKNFHLIDGDISDKFSVFNILDSINPGEIYNLAAQSHVHTSFSQPEYTWAANYGGVLNILEWMKKNNGVEHHNVKLGSPVYICKPRFYQASTSEMFGSSVSYKDSWEHRHDTDTKKMHNCFEKKCFQDEQTLFSPCSPYAISKLAAHQLISIYRQSYGLFACSGILFNHESERRGEEFVTRKITKWAGELVAWLKSNKDENCDSLDFQEDYIVNYIEEKFPKLRLGNLDARRDWGHSEDYVRAMWMMLQNNEADDYVVATGETRTVREFLTKVLLKIGIPLKIHQNFYVIDKEFYRPLEVDYLRGDSSKIRRKLRWKPEISFDELVDRMVLADSNPKV